jgi:hypothetical protein
MPRLLLPVWVNRASTIYLTILFSLIFLGFHWTAFIWYILGASAVDDYELEIEEFEEEEQDEEEISFFDLIIESAQREPNVLRDHQALLEIFDVHLVEPFHEPNFDYPEALDALIWTLKFHKQQVEKKTNKSTLQ